MMPPHSILRTQGQRGHSMKIRFQSAIVTVALVIFPALARADDAPAIELQPFLHGLVAPVYLTNDSTSRIFVLEESGRIRLIQDGKLFPIPYLDIHKLVTLDPST